MGVTDKMIRAVKYLLTNTEACIKVFFIDWFDIGSGLLQGCGLPPTLLNLYVNSLAEQLKALGSWSLFGEQCKTTMHSFISRCYCFAGRKCN